MEVKEKLRQKIAVVESEKEYLSHSVDVWRLDYFNSGNGGYLVTHRNRIERSYISKNEAKKFSKEFNMAKVFAQNGYRVEMLKEVPRVSSPDVTIGGIKADLKRVSSHNNIVKDAKNAVRKQGAEIVLFEFERDTKEIHARLLKLSKEGIHGYFYFSNNTSKIYGF